MEEALDAAETEIMSDCEFTGCGSAVVGARHGLDHLVGESSVKAPRCRAGRFSLWLGLRSPRMARTHYSAGPHVSAGQPVIPGNLVFFGSGPNRVTHGGIAISATEMVNALHQGAVVRIERIWWRDFLGATRPAGSRDA